jgi:trk system potassium uptake protein
MRKQIVVVGLGQFGMGLVKSLSTKNVDVIAVDIDEKKVLAASSYVTHAMSMDATDEEGIMQLSPASRDVCICATGDQSKEAAIICTALLKQMGAKRVIARANDELHARILRLVGADEIINPEWEFGAKFSNRIVSEDILEEMSLGSDLVVTEFKVPASMTENSLVELDLRRKFGITVIAIRRAAGQVRQANPDEVIHEGDILIVISNRGEVERLLNQK